MSIRDEFSTRTRDTLAKRAGYLCSNPQCQKSTSGPTIEDHRTVNIGVAAHISAAAPGGPRYDHSLTANQRKSISNGIWLCQNCAKLIDSDEVRYDSQVLTRWKRDAENAAINRIESSGRKNSTKSPVDSQEWSPPKPNSRSKTGPLELEHSLYIHILQNLDSFIVPYFHGWEEDLHHYFTSGVSDFDREKYEFAQIDYAESDSTPSTRFTFYKEWIQHQDGSSLLNILKHPTDEEFDIEITSSRLRTIIEDRFGKDFLLLRETLKIKYMQDIFLIWDSDADSEPDPTSIWDWFSNKLSWDTKVFDGFSPSIEADDTIRWEKHKDGYRAIFEAHRIDGQSDRDLFTFWSGTNQ